jgi:hypothetical protein
METYQDLEKEASMKREKLVKVLDREKFNATLLSRAQGFIDGKKVNLDAIVSFTYINTKGQEVEIIAKDVSDNTRT